MAKVLRLEIAIKMVVQQVLLINMLIWDKQWFFSHDNDVTL